MITNNLENFEGISQKYPAYYKYYPNLFSIYFKYENEEIIEKLAKSIYLYFQYILFTELVSEDKNSNLLANNSIYEEESFKILNSIFPDNTALWQYFNKRKLEYNEILKNDKRVIVAENQTLQQYINFVDKKSIFGKIAIDCLFYLNKEKDKKLYVMLLESHKYYSVGFQLFEDVKYFQEYFQKKQFNWAFHKLQNILADSEKKYPINMQYKLLFLRGTAEQTLKLAIKYLKKSLQIIEPLPKNTFWEQIILQTIEKIKIYFTISDKYVRTIHARISLKNKNINKVDFFNFEHVKNKTIYNGLNFIKNEYNNNFAELKHIMILEKKEGFKNLTDIHISDIFQRAILNDCLLDIGKKYNLPIQEFIQEEINYLIKNRQKDKIGGWSYFKTLKENAPDIDDLGQIMQLFIKSENVDLIPSLCSNAIQIVINDRTVDSGGLETWIIPKTNQTLLHKKQELYNESKWGKGPDVEVVANFILALYLFDKKKFEKNIANANKYIINLQNQFGYWESKWYIGPYYGTYICVKLLIQFKEKYIINITQAVKFLINSQNADGGFGLNQNSDSLNTALVLITLKMLKNENLSSFIKRAEEYLFEKQNQDGSWEAINFIVPKFGEVYKSSTLTTGYVLKSLV